MGREDRDPTETGACSPSAPTTAFPAAADVLLRPLLAGPRRTARVVAATPLAAYAELDGRGPGPDPACGEGAVVALLGPGAVRVPGALTVAAGWPLLGAAVRLGSALVIGGGTVTLDVHVVRPARWYDSAVPRVARTGAGAPDAATVGLPPLPAEVAPGAGALALALTRRGGGDEALAAAVRALVGLGPGLTPAGDDVLAGALVALAATGGEVARLARLVAPLLRRTTRVSAALLGHAAAGRGVPELARFVAGAAAGSTSAAMVQDLLRVGSSSGAALAHGALAGLGARVREVA